VSAENADDIQTTPATQASDEASDEPQSIILRRVVPMTALALIFGLVGLIAYSVVWPSAGTGNPSGIAINESGALVNLEPRPANDFTLNLFDGGSVRLSDLRGQVVVINFWASWCPPCRQEAPDLNRVWAELQDEDVVFLGLNVWDDRDNALGFINEYNVSYSNGVTEEGAVAVDFGVRGIPETFIVNREGLIAAKFIGPVEAEALIETVRQVRDAPAANAE
jgi:cytochrome c biogenesis protein CcmG/thiol:disulfide interchange protein DsbE